MLTTISKMFIDRRHLPLNPHDKGGGGKKEREILKINVALRPTHSITRKKSGKHTKHLRKYNCGIIKIRERR